MEKIINLKINILSLGRFHVCDFARELDKNGKYRIVWVDIAKGIGIILVVFGHMIDLHSFPGMYIWSFHMPLFFFLSGMFMQDTLSLYLIQRRARQLLLPCIVFAIISYAVMYFVLRRPVDLLNSQSLPGPLWFLTTLFLADMECRLLVKYISIRYLIGVNLLASFVFQFLDWNLPYSLLSVFIASFFYLIGSVSRHCYLLSGGGKSSIILLLTIVSLPIIIYVFNVHTALNINSITPIGVVTALIGITQIVMISRLISKCGLLTRGLSFLGRNSLVIMVTHMIFLQLYCYYVDISSVLIFKGLQAMFVFGLSIVSIYIFQGRWAVLIGKMTTNDKTRNG